MTGNDQRRRLPALVALVLVAATTVLAAAALRRDAPVLGDAGLGWAWLALTALLLPLQRLQVHHEIRQQRVTTNVADLPVLVGLVVLALPALLLARALVSAVTSLREGLRPTKVVVNTAFGVFETALAAYVLTLLAPAAAWPDAFGLAAAGAGAGAVGLAAATTSLVLLAMLRGLGERIGAADVGSALVSSAASTWVTAGLATLGLLAARGSPAGFVPLLALLPALALAARAAEGERRRRADLERLRAFTVVPSAARGEADLVPALLDDVRAALRTSTAALHVPAGGAVRVVRTDATGTRTRTIPARDLDPVRSAVLAGRRAAVRAPRGTTDPGLASWLRREGCSEALLVPLDASAPGRGLLEVADRAGADTFGAAEERLLSTMAGHAAVTLDNARLVDRLRHDATHDGLTGLANRTAFHAALATATAEEERCVVLLLDLDRFKEVNETLGHAVGDALLVEAATRLSAALSDDALLARLGGDEFAVLLPGATADQAVERCLALVEALRQPLELGEVSVDVSASCGLACHPEDAADAAQLLQRADVAMYAAKDAGGGVRRFSDDLEQPTPERLALVVALREAVEAEALGVHYQPKVRLSDGAVVGVEALVRWDRDGRPVPPDVFVPIAEATGLIDALTSLVLRTALAQCRAWCDAGLQVGVAVNVSARLLGDPAFPVAVDWCLRDSGVPPELLTLEITESMVLGGPHRVLPVLASLSDLGVTLSVDDFGTGYSSLAYLRRLPVHEVKIDKSFVREMASDSGDATVVSTVVTLGHALGLRVVAEGLEDEESRDALAQMGCDVAQGYLLSRPLPADAATAWLLRRPCVAGRDGATDRRPLRLVPLPAPRGGAAAPRTSTAP